MHLALVNSSPTETYEVSKKHGNNTSASPLLEMLLTRQHNQDFVESSSECWCQSLLDHCIWSPGKSPAQLTQSPSIQLCIQPYTTILHIHLLSLLLICPTHAFKAYPQKIKLQINHLAFSFCQFHEHVSTCNCAVSSIKYPHLHITDKYTEVFAFAMKPTEITKNCKILN